DVRARAVRGEHRRELLAGGGKGEARRRRRAVGTVVVPRVAARPSGNGRLTTAVVGEGRALERAAARGRSGARGHEVGEPLVAVGADEGDAPSAPAAVERDDDLVVAPLLEL